MSDERARLNLEAVLGSLPPNQREALVLLKMQGLSLTEVAAFAGTSVASIKMRLQRAYRSLRVHLREEAPAASSFEQGRTRR
jgi:RNA polymerase sigma-70 factor (ECF subfamily)